MFSCVSDGDFPADDTHDIVQGTETDPELPPADNRNTENNRESNEFVITEEEYESTLTAIENLVINIDTIIRNRDFETWKTFLSDSYIDAYDSPEDLAGYTQAYKQKGYDIRLANLKDYFNYVVVVSRINAVIDHLVFIDETHLKVITIYKEESAVLYYMEQIDIEWKISVWN